MPVVPVNELHLCGCYQKVAVRGHKTHALCTGGRGVGGHGVVWAVFNLVSRLGADKSLKKQQRGIGFQ